MPVRAEPGGAEPEPSGPCGAGRSRAGTKRGRCHSPHPSPTLHHYQRHVYSHRSRPRRSCACHCGCERRGRQWKRKRGRELYAMMSRGSTSDLNQLNRPQPASTKPLVELKSSQFSGTVMIWDDLNRSTGLFPPRARRGLTAPWVGGIVR